MKPLHCLIMLIAFTGCFLKSDYEKIVDKELQSGKRYDSLFFNIKLGNTKQEFFDVCRSYNKKGILQEGEIDGDQAVKYRMTELKHAAEMNFFPKFYKDKLCDMQATFRYEAWAPWNKDFYSDHLQLEIIRLLEKWYGSGFIQIKNKKEKYPAFVKINGNRRISVFRSDDMMVRVFFTDLLVEKELKGSLDVSR